MVLLLQSHIEVLFSFYFFIKVIVQLVVLRFVILIFLIYIVFGKHEGTFLLDLH